jgi:Domain of unknown function (DUF4365)
LPFSVQAAAKLGLVLDRYTMFPQQIIQELISVAHVQAVAARAGVSISNFDKDFGIDGTFRQIATIGNRRFMSGYALDFQLKASTNYTLEPKDVVYDLEVKTYNDLVQRRLSSDATPCILLLKVLNSDGSKWLTTDETGLFLGGACYWSYLEGELSQHKQSVRIRIPRVQEFCPESLLKLITSAREYTISGEWTC